MGEHTDRLIALAGTERVSGYRRTNKSGKSVKVDSYFRSPGSMSVAEIIGEAASLRAAGAGSAAAGKDDLKRRTRLASLDREKAARIRKGTWKPAKGVPVSKVERDSAEVASIIGDGVQGSMLSQLWDDDALRAELKSQDLDPAKVDFDAVRTQLLERNPKIADHLKDQAAEPEKTVKPAGPAKPAGDFPPALKKWYGEMAKSKTDDYGASAAKSLSDSELDEAIEQRRALNEKKFGDSGDHDLRVLEAEKKARAKKP